MLLNTACVFSMVITQDLDLQLYLRVCLPENAYLIVINTAQYLVIH